MSLLQLIVPGADFSSVGLGRLSILPGGANLYAGYALGTDYVASPLADQSYNSRTLTLNGTGGQGAKSFVSGSGAYLTTPFTGAQLMAKNGGATVVAVASMGDTVAATLAAAFRISPGSNGIGLVSGSTYKERAYDSGGSTQLDLSSATARGTAFECFAASWSSTGKLLYRRRADFGAAETASDALPVASGGGANPFAIGYMPGAGGFTSSATIAAVLFLDRSYTAAELDGVYADLQSFLGSKGTTV